MTRTAAVSTADSTPFDAASAGAAKDDKTGVARLRRIASEPFVHFTLLGALVFAGHRLVTRSFDAPTLEVSMSRQRQLVKLFEQRQRRPPNDTEREQLIQRYVEDEALFREGLRLSLVQTDPMLRAQIIARVRGMLQAELDQKPATETELRRYYEAHRSDYALAPEPPFAAIRERVRADYRKEQTARAFQTELGRLTAQWRVQIAERP